MSKLMQKYKKIFTSILQIDNKYKTHQNLNILKTQSKYKYSYKMKSSLLLETKVDITDPFWDLNKHVDRYYVQL